MGLYPEHMSIEAIRAHLDFFNEDVGHNIEVDFIIDSIVVIRSKAYNDGWHDAITEMDGEL